jgi:DHA2 family multidrug resistance protein-like MFS transporter
MITLPDVTQTQPKAGRKQWDLIISAAPPQRAGAGAGLSQTSREFGSALGIAVLGSIIAAVYHDRLPGHVPDQARETLGGAIAVAKRLPQPAAAELVRTAREAFIGGLELTALIAAAIMAVTAIAATMLLRDVRVDAASSATPAPKGQPQLRGASSEQS